MIPSKHFETMGSTFFSTSENWQYPFARCRILCSSISCIFWWQTRPNDSLDSTQHAQVRLQVRTEMPHPPCVLSCLNISRWRSAVSPCSRRSSAPCCTSAAEPRNRSCFPLPCASGRGRGAWPSAWTTGGKRQKRRWRFRRFRAPNSASLAATQPWKRAVFYFLDIQLGGVEVMLRFLCLLCGLFSFCPLLGRALLRLPDTNNQHSINNKKAETVILPLMEAKQMYTLYFC